MILADFECSNCGNIFERITDSSQKVCLCPECMAVGTRIITVGHVYKGNQDAAWLKTVIDVVDKDPSKLHCQEFIKSPTRDNYQRWMKGEGIRPLENNEPMKPPPVDMTNANKEVWEKYQARQRIEVR